MLKAEKSREKSPNFNKNKYIKGCILKDISLNISK